MAESPKSVGEAFPKEQARVRELLNAYRDLGPAGAFGVMVLEQTLRFADQAAISGDPVLILSAFEQLKDCQ